ncbi:DUF4158 domain-containing protein [Streptomyces sp. NPDC002138]|uniref:DUF4158 domain-containing protein n=1 Tax=Streptomyces sp. NPDC002138 TaxID=3154410 RepID=UPI003331E4F0
MTVEYLSEEQIARYGGFVGERSVQELEEFFRLDVAAMEQAAAKRRPHSRLGGAVGHGADARQPSCRHRLMCRRG